MMVECGCFYCESCYLDSCMGEEIDCIDNSNIVG